MKHVVVLSGAGISAESGIRTFRDTGGLWEEYSIEEVATPDAWRKDYRKVLDFYNRRRKQVIESEPNKAHYALADLEKAFRVTIITQNIDDLHERAGSANVLHLHGEIMKARSTTDHDLVYPVDGWQIHDGDVCEKGSQLRPHIVWFGEDVPLMETAMEIVEDADIVIVTGTSLSVYPAAGLIWHIRHDAQRFCVDPKPAITDGYNGFSVITANAGEGIPALVNQLLKTAGSHYEL